MDFTSIKRWVRERPRVVTAAVSILGYALVGAAFAGVLPLFPALGDATVLLFGDLIAIVNSLALTALLAGLVFIRRGKISRHRIAMMTAFGLILVFLILYLWKVGGGFEKSIIIEASDPLGEMAGLVRPVYLAMLAVHIILSVVAVPVVIHAVVLGLTHDISELPNTAHPRVGRIAVAAWSLSLALGVITYLLLNHVYGWERAFLWLLGIPAINHRH